jgi:hypothetical protein
LADFSSGVVWIQTQRQDRLHVALIPLEGFVKFFGPNPRAVADTIHAKAEEVVTRWKEHNAGTRLGERKTVGFVYDIFTHEWKGAKGKQEKSVFELHINSWTATSAQQWEQGVPRIALADLKVLLKVRSTVVLDERPDKAGKSPDGLNLSSKGGLVSGFNLVFVLKFFLAGYNNNLRHFLGLLRSPPFAELLARHTVQEEAELPYQPESQLESQEMSG